MSKDDKMLSTSPIQSFEQMYSALAEKLSGVAIISSGLKTLSDQVSALEQARKRDCAALEKLFDEIERLQMRDPPVTTTAPSSCSPEAVINPITQLINERVSISTSQPVETAEQSLKAKMLLSIANMDNFHPFNGEDAVDAAAWLQDFVDRSNFAGATDDFRLKAAPMNFQGVAKMWYMNHKEQLTSWPVFTDQFLTYFCPDDSHRERLGEKLYTRRQSLDESALHYYDDVNRLCSKFDPLMSSVDRVNILLKGARPEARDWVDLRNPSTPADFLRLMTEYERRMYQETRKLGEWNSNDNRSHQYQRRSLSPTQSQPFVRLPFDSEQHRHFQRVPNSPTRHQRSSYASPPSGERYVHEHVGPSANSNSPRYLPRTDHHRQNQKNEQ